MAVSIIQIQDPQEKSRICDQILHALPNWFGIESSIVDYVNDVPSMIFFAAMEGSYSIGFAALKIHNPYTCEVYIMGIQAEYHRQGIGQKLILACETHCKASGAEFLTVKTLDEARADPYYEKTRKFYLSMGFRPLEVFPTLWDISNPCLLMAKALPDNG